MHSNPRWSQRALEEGGPRRRSSGGTVSYDGGMSSRTEHFLRGTRRLSKDGTRRDKKEAGRTRSRRGGTGGDHMGGTSLCFRTAIAVMLMLLTYVVATKVPSLVVSLFLPDNRA